MVLIYLYRSSARLVKSSRAGVGKTLYVRRSEEKLRKLNKSTANLVVERVSIPLQEKDVDLNDVIGRFLLHVTDPHIATTRLFHINIAHEVTLTLIWIDIY